MKQRLTRLRRLEKLREIAKQAAALEAAEAESTLKQLQALSERTRSMAADYASRREVADGASLVHLGRFVSGLHAISRNTDNDAMRARSVADARLEQLAQSERRRAAIQERADLQARMIAKAAQNPALGSRRTIGTELE
ncbi:hypothetical protein B2G71_01480 [Novosphingobium sp. PC22D]|uniref:hypothetical protein n=1 Tax=Novosphingobium sp. PC22D TaxID=1962403 RepID=UPI000BF1EE7B|nr:hypothetical protein [Novosphingobium sp. PC22D]PEQ14301.1 hypothetical protein B2G71_01480 [Novosphingobium sp. PC22D]